MNKITNYKVDYVKLSKCIRDSLIQGRTIDFEFDFDKLAAGVAEYDLLVVPNPVKSKRIGPEDIVFIGEFFKGDKLSWIDHHKYYSSLVFVRTDVEGALDEEFYELMEDMKKPLIDNPDIDKAETLARILAKYPCYVATVVSYKNADIKRTGLLNTEIICKANTVTIKLDNYEYHHEDIQ